MQPSITSLPDVLLSLVASYIQDDVDAADPECFRSARRLQALCRGTLARLRGNACYHCALPLACRHWTVPGLMEWIPNSTAPGANTPPRCVCDNCMAELAGGRVLPTHYDQHGFDSEGYDAEGYDRAGYDRYFFDRYGQDLLLPSDDDDSD